MYQIVEMEDTVRIHANTILAAQEVAQEISMRSTWRPPSEAGSSGN